MTRSYTSKEGVLVEVSQQHLDKSVAIKLELQEQSPSRQCNWKKHKEMMESEGFFDSEVSDNYRCLIKDYQRKNGTLPSLSKHIDYITTSKLETIHNEVGNLYFQKRENQLVLNNLNKVKRDLSLTGIIAEEYRNLLLDELVLDVPSYAYKERFQGSKNKAVLTLTDWHVGVVVNDCVGNSFNLEIAKKRIDKLLDETIYYCKLYKVTELHVASLGDMVEQIYMRANQSQWCEFGLAKQMSEAKRLIWSFLVRLSKYVNVIFVGIAGNHDRIAGDKAVAFDGDNAMFVVNEGIKDNIEISKTKRISLIDLDQHATDFVLELNGRKLKFGHGHAEKTSKGNKLNQHISVDREFYDAYIQGHLHHFFIEESNHGSFSMGVGCLMGRNVYSKDIGCATDASQAIIVVREDGEMIPIKISLQVA